MAKIIGICAHSYEGGALCFRSVCREGAKIMGPHMHPTTIVSAIPMGLSMKAWEENNYDGVAINLLNGAYQLYKAGADFLICPDNTAHIALERIISKLPIPGLHIVDIVCAEIKANKWKKVALLGTKWTMTGDLYANKFKENNLDFLVPNNEAITKINTIIFDELCQGIFKPISIEFFRSTINELKLKGAECVVLGCTEIPLIINTNNSSLPILDSTRLLSKYAVKLAMNGKLLPNSGWIKV